MRNIRTLNQTTNQMVESQKGLTRIGDLSYRDLGVFARMFLIDQGKALIMGGGLIVSPAGIGIVSISAGKLFQRIDSGDIIMGSSDIQTLTLATPSYSTVIIECQVTLENTKTDSAEVITDTTVGAVGVQTIYRDKSYGITIREKSSSTATAGTTGRLLGNINIPSPIDCSVKYILNICDGEDGNFQEINIQGATPSATTRAEIISKINAAVGRTMATSSGNAILLTGGGTGQTSYFEIKNPADLTQDAAEIVLGININYPIGVYGYTYQGTNQWVKLAEIIWPGGTMTAGMIKDLTAKSTWASGDGDVFTWGMTPGTWNTGKSYTTADYVYSGDMLYQCAVAHTAGVFSTDFGAGKWNMVNTGAVATCDNSTESATTFSRLQTLLNKSINSGSLFSNPIVSTYSLVYTIGGAYSGGVLGADGSIHFIPSTATVGQKISPSGVVSTYSLVYTNAGGAYCGGVLAADGSIHMMRYNATVGQKISALGVVSTYSLVYTAGNCYGGVLGSDGSIYITPGDPIGQKISASGVVSTYSLIYTNGAGSTGTILGADGSIYMIGLPVGQKISSSGIVSTFVSQYPTAGYGGVIGADGSIYVVPWGGLSYGVKISKSDVMSTYSLIYTTSAAGYYGGVLGPDGSVYFVPYCAPVGQRISMAGIVSTYSLIYTTGGGIPAFLGGVLGLDGAIHFVPNYSPVGQKIQLGQNIPWSPAMCMSPYFNKF